MRLEKEEKRCFRNYDRNFVKLKCSWIITMANDSWCKGEDGEGSASRSQAGIGHEEVTYT